MVVQLPDFDWSAYPNYVLANIKFAHDPPFSTGPTYDLPYSSGGQQFARYFGCELLCKYVVEKAFDWSAGLAIIDLFVSWYMLKCIL